MFTVCVKPPFHLAAPIFISFNIHSKAKEMFSSFRRHQKATVRAVKAVKAMKARNAVEAVKSVKAVKATNKVPPGFPFWLIIMCMI